MKQLYQITDTQSSAKDKAVPGLFFSEKKQAKERRQALNEDESNPHKLRYIVSPGPDHHRYKATK